MAIPLAATSASLHHLAVVEAVVAALALLLAGAVGWQLMRAGLRPLAEVETTAGAIASGRLDQRAQVAGPRTEVGRLGGAFNSMLDRIQDAFAQRDATEARLRRFVADASHELRTPLAAVSAYAELFERGAALHPDDLARAMRGIRGETARMHALVEDLLLLARLDEGQPLAAEPVELVSLVAQAVDAARTVGPDWPVELDAIRPVEVVGDRARLRHAIDNLLANVRAHTPAGTPAVVRVGEAGHTALIEVVDREPGLSPEQASRVFERFYRADPSRSRHHGGAGLGLSIVAGIVAAHSGSVSASSDPGASTTFTIRLPFAAGAPPAYGARGEGLAQHDPGSSRDAGRTDQPER